MQALIASIVERDVVIRLDDGCTQQLLPDFFSVALVGGDPPHAIDDVRRTEIVIARRVRHGPAELRRLAEKGIESRQDEAGRSRGDAGPRLSSASLDRALRVAALVVATAGASRGALITPGMRCCLRPTSSAPHFASPSRDTRSPCTNKAPPDLDGGASCRSRGGGWLPE